MTTTVLTTPIITPLAGHDAAEMDQCEAVIQSGLVTFVEVGNALLTIKTKRLYREKFATFEEYCATRWGISTRRAYQLIEAAEVVTTIVTADDVKKITQFPNEAQARALAKLPATEQPKVWKGIIESGEKPTAAAIAKASPSPIPTVRDSPRLAALKKYWRRASKQDRIAFMKWIGLSGSVNKYANASKGSYEDWKKWRDVCWQLTQIVDGMAVLRPDAQHIIGARDAATKVCKRIEKEINRITSK